MWMRILAVAAVMATAGTGAISYTKAGRVLQVQIGHFQNIFKEEPADLSEAPAEFTKRWYERFTTTGQLADAPRSGRPPLIPNAEAFEAASILVAGYIIEKNVAGRAVTEHKYYSSVPEAVAHNASLKGIMDKYHASPEQLLAAMRRVEPGLMHRRVSFRHMLSAAEKAKRRTVCLDLLSRYHADPTLLQRMVFIDETTIQTHGLKKDHVNVWVNSSDTGFRDFHGVPGKAWHPVKVHVIAAVSAHPRYESTGGLVYVDFTTGTTDIKRRYNKRLDGSTRDPAFKYTVSWLPLLNMHNASSTMCGGQGGVMCQQGLYVWQLLALVWHPLLSITGA